MAPIPKDGKEKHPDEDDSGLDSFSVPHLSVMADLSDSSEENDDEYENLTTTAGYTLLSQDPCGIEDDDDDDDDEDKDNFCNAESVRESQNNDGIIDSDADAESLDVKEMIENLPDGFTPSDAGVNATASSSPAHPAFLAKFADRKLPSYMQVPPLSHDSKGLLWNQKRQEKNSISIDSGHESTILKAMAGFSLPKNHIPEWAQGLSEEQWKQQVLMGISSKNSPANVDFVSGPRKQEKTMEETSKYDCNEGSTDWVASFPDS